MVRAVMAVRDDDACVVPGAGENCRGLQVLGEPVHLPLVPPEIAVGRVQEYAKGLLCPCARS